MKPEHDAACVKRVEALGLLDAEDARRNEILAREALSDGPCRIDRFPFRIVRLSHNPLVHNDLTIEDDTPWQISRHHLAFVLLDGRVAVADRGSTLGSSVDGRRLGGERGEPGPLTFSGDRGSLVLGNEKSPFRFDVTIQSE